MTSSLVVILIVCTSVVVLISYVQGRSFDVKRLVQCPGKRNLPVIFDHAVFARDKTGKMQTYFKLDCYVRRTVQKLSVVVNFWKCDASGNPDTCEWYLKDFNATNVCELMGKQHQVWTEMVQKMHLPKSCPIPPGNYTMDNMKVDQGLLLLLPISSGLWKMTFTGFDYGEMVACALYEMVIK